MTSSLPLFLRDLPLLRLHHHHDHNAAAHPRRPLSCSAVFQPNGHEDSEKSSVKFRKQRTTRARWDDPDYRRWKDAEAEILRDIEFITSLTKEILHSNRCIDGEHLSVEDEKAVVEKLLKYHPHAEDKIGCGLGSIKVDRHPQFRQSRCLFVVRTDGVWIDFSYQRCLRAYVRDKYPSYAERFIREHFNRGSI